MSRNEVIPIIPIPKARIAKASVWRHIGVAETDHVLKLQNVDETKAFLMEKFGIQRDPDGKYLIVLDMFYYAVQFSKNSNFTSEKTSSLLSIVKQTHEMAIETPFGNIHDTLCFFKNLVLCHSVHRPPFSLGIFSTQEASSISNYFIDTYFRHFKLYKYIFTPQVLLDLNIGYSKFPQSARFSEDDNKNFDDEEELCEENKSGLTDQSEMGENEPQQPSLMRENRTPRMEEFEGFDSTNESVGQLKRLIRERLVAELQELQTGVYTQLQQSDETIEKLAIDAAGISTKQQQSAAVTKKKK